MFGTFLSAWVAVTSPVFLLISVDDIPYIPDVQVSVMFGTFLLAWVAVTSPVYLLNSDANIP